MYEIERSAISTTKDELLNLIDELSYTMKREYDSLELPRNDKAHLKHILDGKIKEIKQEYIRVKEIIVATCRHVYEQEDTIIQLMVEFSREFCPTCRKHISDTIEAFDNRRNNAKNR